MQIRFVLPPCVDSPLSRLDPRWRLAGLAAVVVPAAAARSPGAALAGLGVAAVLAAAARPPRAWLIERLVGLAVVAGAFAAPLPLFAAGGPVEGLRLVVLLLAKAGALFLLSAVVLVTAPLEATLSAAAALGVPRLLTGLTQMSLRYLSLVGEELARLRIALRVRGFRNRPGGRAYRTVAAATGMLLVRGNARGLRVAQAMRCRGFDGRFRSLGPRATTASDVAFLLTLLAAAAALLLLDAWLASPGAPS